MEAVVRYRVKWIAWYRTIEKNKQTNKQIGLLISRVI